MAPEAQPRRTSPGAPSALSPARIRELPHEHLLDLALEASTDPKRGAEFRQAVRETRARIAAGGLDQSFALEFLLTRLMAITRSTGTALALMQGKDLVCTSNSGPTVPELGATSSSETGLCAECLRTRQVIYCEDADSDPRADREACRFLGVRAVIMAAYPSNADPQGVVQVYSSGPGMFTARDLTVMPFVARTLANITNAQELETEDAATEAASSIVADAGVSPQYAEFLGELLGPNAKDFPNAELAEGALPPEPPSVPPPPPPPAEHMPFSRAMQEAEEEDIWAVPSDAQPPPSLPVSGPLFEPRLRGRPQPAAAGSAEAAHLAYAEVLEALEPKPEEPQTITAVAEPAVAEQKKRPDLLTNILEFAVPAAVTALLIAIGVYWNNQRRPPDGNPVVITIPAPSEESLPDFLKAKEKIERELPKPDINLESNDGAPAIRAGSPPGVIFRIEPAKPPSAEADLKRAPKLGPYLDRVLVSPVVMQARLVRMVAPLNPAGTHGTVVLHGVIDKTGQVKQVELASGNPMLAPWAITAVTQWRYVPYFQNGRPVDVETEIQVTFQ